MAAVFVAYGAIDAFSPLTTVTVASTAGLVVMVPLAAAGRALLPSRERAAGVIGVSVLDMLAFLAASAALAAGPVSVASVLLAQTATVSAVPRAAAAARAPGVVADGRRAGDDRRGEHPGLDDVERTLLGVSLQA